MRKTVTTTAVQLIANTAASTNPDSDTRSFVLRTLATSNAIVLLKPSSVGTQPDMSDAARWDFASAMLAYPLEPGRSLWGQAQSATVALEILEGGER